MSLINQMLRDLDRRHASAAERAALGGQLRTLPALRRSPWLRAVPLAAGLAVGAGALWVAFESQSWRDAEPVKLAADRQPAAPAMALPVFQIPMPVDSTSQPASLPAVRLGELQLDARLSRAPSLPSAEAASPASPPVHAAVTPEATAPAIDKRPGSQAGADAAESDYRKALAAYRQGRSHEATTGFQAALAANARHAASRQALLSLFMEQRRWPEAAAVASEGLGLDAAQPGWAMILARLQVEQGQAVDAEQTMARYAAHGERHADYQAFHGLLLQRLQRPSEAAERFRAAAGLRPGEGRWWYGLGLALDADQRPQEARDAFERAREAGNLPPELVVAIDQRLR